MLNGSNHVVISDNQNNFVCYQLEIKIRNFRNTHPDNSFVFGVFDCCRNVPGLGIGHPLVEVDVAKGDEKAGLGEEYI